METLFYAALFEGPDGRYTRRYFFRATESTRAAKLGRAMGRAQSRSLVDVIEAPSLECLLDTVRPVNDLFATRESVCSICACPATAEKFGFPVCAYHDEHGESDAPCATCGMRQ